MTWPAYEEFPSEHGVSASIFKVYMHLRPPVLSFDEPREVRVLELAALLHMQPHRARLAVDWLIERGYLILNGRAERRVRAVRLAYVKAPQRVSSAAA